MVKFFDRKMGKIDNPVKITDKKNESTKNIASFVIVKKFINNGDIIVKQIKKFTYPRKLIPMILTKAYSVLLIGKVRS